MGLPVSGSRLPGGPVRVARGTKAGAPGAKALEGEAGSIAALEALRHPNSGALEALRQPKLSNAASFFVVLVAVRQPDSRGDLAAALTISAS